MWTPSKYVEKTELIWFNRIKIWPSITMFWIDSAPDDGVLTQRRIKFSNLRTYFAENIYSFDVPKENISNNSSINWRFFWVLYCGNIFDKYLLQIIAQKLFCQVSKLNQPHSAYMQIILNPNSRAKEIICQIFGGASLHNPLSVCLSLGPC